MRKHAPRAGRRPAPAPASRAAAAAHSQQWGVFLAVLCGCLGGLLFTRWTPPAASLERVMVNSRSTPSLRAPGAASALRFVEDAPLQLGEEQPAVLPPPAGAAAAAAAAVPAAPAASAAPAAQALPPPLPVQAPPQPPPPAPPAAAAAAVPAACASRQAHISAHRAALASLGLPNAAQGPRGTHACASSSATHLAYMEGYRQVVPEAGELLLQVQELAINFDLTSSTVVLAGVEPPSALSTEVTAIERSFARAVHAQSLEELAALLPTLPGPALFVLGTWRADKCTPSLTLQRLQAILTPGAWKHAARSVLVFPRANGYFGVDSPECAGPGVRCDPTALELQAVLCALAPGMNQGMWRGTMRLYPEVTAPWAVRVPVAIPPANLWRKFTLDACMAGEPCEGEATGVGIGSFYIQENVDIVLDPVSGLPTTAPRSGTAASEGRVEWTAEKIAAFESIAKSRGKAYYDQVDVRLYAVLDRHPIRGKSVVIMGSLEPFYELVAMQFGAASVTTVEYGSRIVTDPRFEIITPAQLLASGRRFDVAFSISSFEHDGLGRYGDPLDPEGDLKAMAYMKASVVKPGGALVLAMPSGGDFVEFNAHRIYGRLRFPLLTKGWKLVDSEDFSEGIWGNGGGWQVQPVYYLENTA